MVVGCILDVIIDLVKSVCHIITHYIASSNVAVTGGSVYR